MLELDTEELRVIIHELDQAIYNHEQWSKRLARTLLCHTPCDEHDVSADAHRNCLFGQWYYRRTAPGLQSIPGFVAIGIEHQRMHEQAAQLLRDAATGVVSPADFDSFRKCSGQNDPPGSDAAARVQRVDVPPRSIDGGEFAAHAVDLAPRIPRNGQTRHPGLQHRDGRHGPFQGDQRPVRAPGR